MPPLVQRTGARGRERPCGSGSGARSGPLAGEEAGGGGACQGTGEGSCVEAKWGALGRAGRSGGASWAWALRVDLGGGGGTEC